MRLGSMVGRSAATLGLLGGAAWFIWVFGPRPTPAYADVYVPLSQMVGLIPPPAGPGTTMSEPREVRLNGQGFHYTVGHSNLPVADVLSYYEGRVGSVVPLPNGPLKTSFRLDGNGMGVIAGVTAPRTDFTSRGDASSPDRGLRLSDVGNFHVIVAYAASGTVFLHLTPDSDARIGALLPPAAGDAPGVDPPLVGRCPGTQRLLTVEQDSSQGPSTTTFYRTRRDAGSTLAFYVGALRQAGWSLDDQFGGLQSRDRMAHLARGSEECFLAIVENPDDRILAFVYRREA